MTFSWLPYVSNEGVQVLLASNHLSIHHALSYA